MIDRETRALVRRALKEDAGPRGDLSTRFFLPAGTPFQAELKAKEGGILCGRAVVDEAFRQAAPAASVSWKIKEGGAFKKGTALAVVTGPREIMTAERTALNFLQHLSGIATLTARFVAKVRGTRAKIYDTRKTLPGWRALAKYAVRTGGGRNHRMDLSELVMLKDNHLAGISPGDPESVAAAAARLKAFRAKHPRIPVEMEASGEDELRLALALKADIVMLDNMEPSELRANIRLIRRTAPRTEIEISGGVGLDGVARLARLGPDRISVGRLTHSAPAIDISMKITGR